MAKINEKLKNTLKKRQQLEEIKSYAIDSASIGIGITDLKGDLTYVNQVLIQLGGYQKEEVLGQHVTLFFTHEQDMRKALLAVKEKGSWQGELTIKKKDGSKVYVMAWANLVRDNEGNPLSLMATISDISDNKKAMEEQQNQQEIVTFNKILACHQIVWIYP